MSGSPSADPIAVRWRLALARSLATQYAGQGEVVGVLAAGSTARAQADRFSDLELMVLWSAPPVDEERTAVVAAVGGDLHRLYPYDPAWELWEDAYFMGRDRSDSPKSGCLVEVSHYLVTSLEARLVRVIDGTHVDEGALALAAGIAGGRVLHGTREVRALQERVAFYPDALQRAVVQRYGYIDHFWRWEMYAARGDNLTEAHALFTYTTHHAAHLLLAINRRYFTGWKWLVPVLEACPLRPERTTERLREAQRLPIAAGAALLAGVVDDTFDLVEQHVPEVEVAAMRRLFHWQRPQWDGPPPLRLPQG